MTRLLACVLGLCLLPSSAFASPFVLTFGFGYDASLHITPSATLAEMHFQWQEVCSGAQYFDCPSYDLDAIGSISVGAPEEFIGDPSGLGLYEFGAANLVIETALGLFTAAIPDFSFTLFGSSIPTVQEDHIPLGAGVFDPALAAFLGIPQQSSGGYMKFFFDQDSGFPDGFPNNPEFALGSNFPTVTVTVPEPSLLALALAGGIGLLWRRKRNHASSSTSASSC